MPRKKRPLDRERVVRDASMAIIACATISGMFQRWFFFCGPMMAWCPGASAEPQEPNVIVILCDDLGHPLAPVASRVKNGNP